MRELDNDKNIINKNINLYKKKHIAAALFLRVCGLVRRVKPMLLFLFWRYHHYFECWV